MDVLVYDSIDKVSQETWDSLVDNNHIINSYHYLKAIEHSNINQFTYRYLLFYEDHKLIASASVGVLTFYLDLFAQGLLKKLFDRIKAVYPSFLKITFIECGPTTNAGKSILIKDGAFRNEVLKLLDKTIQKIAKENNAHLIGYRDFLIEERKEFDLLLEFNYKIFCNYLDTVLTIQYDNFDQYLNSLVAKRRNEIKRRIKKFQEKGCRIEKIVDFEPICPRIINLSDETSLRAKEYQREVLNIGYYKYLSEYLLENSFVLVCKKQDEIVGFTMLLDSGDTLVSTYCGLDYKESINTYSYFMLFYKTIEEAIKLKKKRIELGVTTYGPKIEVGALPLPQYIYLKAVNPILNLIITPLLKLISTFPWIRTEKVYNFDQLKELFPKKKTTAYSGKHQFRVINLNRKEIIIEPEINSFNPKKINMLILKNPHIEAVELKIGYKKTILKDNRSLWVYKIKKISLGYNQLFDFYLNLSEFFL